MILVRRVSVTHQVLGTRSWMVDLNSKQLFGNVHSVREDVLISYEDICDDFINLKMMCRLGISEVLIGIGCVCMHSWGEYTSVV